MALAGGQHGFVKAATQHLGQLVDQHIARGAQNTAVAMAAAQLNGLRKRPSVGELGECQVDACDVVDVAALQQVLELGGHVNIVGQLQGVGCFSRFSGGWLVLRVAGLQNG